jgi:predicted HTH transcriptional regulator
VAPIPSSTLPGLKPLRDRALTGLQRCQETQSTDFKRSEEWDSLKWRIIETALGMGNLRDGGVIIVGVEEKEDTWELSGVSADHLKTFDVDIVTDQVNSYVSPHLNVTMATLDEDGKTFLIIEVQEFSDTPLVCKKNGPSGSKLFEGAVYVRPPGLAKTTRVMKAEQMHDLLELAAEKRARRLLEVARRVGMVPKETGRQRFDEELGGL